MSYSFELLPGEPIWVATLYASFSLKDDLDPYLDEAISILDNQDQPIYYITDLSVCKLRVFQDFLVAVNRAFRGQNASVNHPNIKTTILISTDKVFQLGAKGLNSEVFGNLSMPVFDTLEEALAYVRTQVEQR